MAVKDINGWVTMMVPICFLWLLFFATSQLTAQVVAPVLDPKVKQEIKSILQMKARIERDIKSKRLKEKTHDYKNSSGNDVEKSLIRDEKGTIREYSESFLVVDSGLDSEYFYDEKSRLRLSVFHVGYENLDTEEEDVFYDEQKNIIHVVYQSDFEESGVKKHKEEILKEPKNTDWCTVVPVWDPLREFKKKDMDN